MSGLRGVTDHQTKTCVVAAMASVSIPLAAAPPHIFTVYFLAVGVMSYFPLMFFSKETFTKIK